MQKRASVYAKNGSVEGMSQEEADAMRAELKNAAKQKHAKIGEKTVGGASEILAIRNERALKMKQKKAKQKRKIYGKVKVYYK